MTSCLFREGYVFQKRNSDSIAWLAEITGTFSEITGTFLKSLARFCEISRPHRFASEPYFHP
jgi:hypothetical protein